MLDVFERIYEGRSPLDIGLTVCFQPLSSSRVYQSHFLIGVSYGNPTLTGGSHILLRVLLTSDIFRYAGKGYGRGLFVHQIALGSAGEGLEK